MKIKEEQRLSIARKCRDYILKYLSRTSFAGDTLRVEMNEINTHTDNQKQGIMLFIGDFDPMDDIHKVDCDDPFEKVE